MRAAALLALAAIAAGCLGPDQAGAAGAPGCAAFEALVEGPGGSRVPYAEPADNWTMAIEVVNGAGEPLQMWALYDTLHDTGPYAEHPASGSTLELLQPGLTQVPFGFADGADGYRLRISLMHEPEQEGYFGSEDFGDGRQLEVEFANPEGATMAVRLDIDADTARVETPHPISCPAS